MVLALSLGPSCNKKKPQFPTEAQQAPTLTVALPDQIPDAAPPPEPPPPTQEAAVTEPPKTKPQGHRRTNSRKASPPPVNTQNSVPSNTIAANRPPENPVVETPTPTDTAIAETTSQTAPRQRQTTIRLLDETEKNLKGLKGSLTHDEAAMVAQIKSYVAQSRQALSAGDLERANNLAYKAHLLSDALVKK
jgi:hypothetical protein